jgi:delta 1-pyrroline-5-carboxylate dehydrogenase
LEESDSAFIAEKIKGLDTSEEAYASLKSELEVFWASKNKEAKAKFEEEVQARVKEEVEKRLSGETSEASETDVEEALDNAEETTSEIPNNNEAQASAGTLKEKFAAAFSRDNILS